MVHLFLSSFSIKRMQYTPRVKQGGGKADTRVCYQASHGCKQLGLDPAGMSLRIVHLPAQVPPLVNGCPMGYHLLGPYVAAEPKWEEESSFFKYGLFISNCWSRKNSLVHPSSPIGPFPSSLVALFYSGRYNSIAFIKSVATYIYEQPGNSPS